MKDQASMVEQAEEDILACTVSDEILEAVASSESAVSRLSPSLPPQPAWEC